MKGFFVLLLLPVVLTSSSDCSKKKVSGYRGKLEIKALCMNYTISIQDENADTSLVVPSWTDENTGKTYSNVFKLGNPCEFPSTIEAGDEFVFEVENEKKDKNCMVCMAYYPVPPKALAIRVLPKQ